MPGAIKKFLTDVAGGFFGNDYLRDFTHASKTFRSGNYQNAPKFKFLFHVYFDINPSAFPNTATQPTNFGVLVKSVKLPSYDFTVETKNQYNRKRLIQTKINYKPVDISFHDDNRNLINSLWYRYYTYYYADGTKPKVVFSGSRGGATQTEIGGGGSLINPTAANYNNRNQYEPSITGDDNWGYIGETSAPSNPSGKKIPFFKNITVYGFEQHNWIAYTLINPVITSFSHDTYAYANNEVMENNMTIDYETVVYNQGNLDGQSPNNIVTGFADGTIYDRKLSPISQPGSNGNILGNDGLIASAGGAVKDFAGGNILGAIQTAGRVYNGVKNINLKQTLKQEVSQSIQNALNNSTNVTRQKLFDIPVYGSSPSNQGTAGSPTNARPAPQNIGTITTAGKQVNYIPEDWT